MASIGIGKYDTDDEEVNNEPPVAAKPTRWPLLAAVAALLLALSGGVYYWMTSRPVEAATDGAGAEKALVDVPAMVISLRTSAGRTHLLKLHVMLVTAGPKSAEPVRAKLPLYIDTLQPFLHELRPEDLNGSAAIFRVKEEMLSRATTIFGDGVVRDVLIQDLIEQ